MPTRNINLTDHFDRFIEAEVGSGRYGSASEVVREGLRLIEDRKREERAKLKWLRAAVKEGLEQIDRGLGVEFRSARDLDKHIDRLWEEVAEPRP
ncbi:MAG: type II toxin-antitoxin system ParD family antitoxin [Bryobacteraceae bacterium]|jgi:antitoxin ParD1/3/4